MGIKRIARRLIAENRSVEAHVISEDGLQEYRGGPKRIAKRVVGSAMKRMLEDISVEMGLGGEINDEVMAEGQRRLDIGQPQDSTPPPKKIYEA